MKVLSTWVKEHQRFCWALVWAGITLFLLGMTLDDMGMTDDDDFYVPAGVQYASWAERAVQGVVKGDFKEFSAQGIKRGFRANHEHPPLAKWMIGAGWLVFHKWTGLLGQIDAGRTGIFALAALLVFLVFHFTATIWGFPAAHMAAAALLLFPRTFFHMHVPTLDLAVSAMTFFVVYAVWRAETSRLWVVLAGIIYGLAMGTKLNAPFVVLPLLVYWFYKLNQWIRLNKPKQIPIRKMVTTGLSMALLSFPVFVIIWPWIWFETLDRLVFYFKFHFYHYGIRLLYFGDIYNNNFAPWHEPFVMTAFCLPLVLLLLCLAGFIAGCWPLRPKNILHPHAINERNDKLMLVAVNALFAISVVAFNHVPKYGGVKLWQPAFPFIAILVGVGFTFFLKQLALLTQKELWFKPSVALILAFFLLLPGTIGMVRTYPFLLSYYGELAGNLPGATEKGFERQYYDMAYRPTIDFFNEQMEPNRKVWFEPNVVEYRRTWGWYHRDGTLRRDIEIRSMKKADFLVLTHERRWDHYPKLYNEYRSYPGLFTRKVWGVPLYSVVRLDKEK